MRASFPVRTLLALFLVIFVPAVSFAVPRLVNYQGRLTDKTSGSPVTASLQLTFSIYTSASGGTSLWAETQGITVTGGTFNALLGSVTPIPPDAFTGDSVYIGVKVGDDQEMTPRQRITSAGYAFHAGSADSVAGSTNIDLLDKEQTVTALKNYSVTGKSIPFTVSPSNNGMVTNLNADMLGGLHSDEYMKATNTIVGRNLSVVTPIPPAGSFRMTGTVAGPSLYAETAGSGPAIEAKGNIQISGDGNGITWPGGSTQASACKSASVSGSVPAGASLSVGSAGLTFPNYAVAVWRDNGGGVWVNVVGNSSYPVTTTAGFVSVTNNSGSAQTLSMTVVGMAQ